MISGWGNKTGRMRGMTLKKIERDFRSSQLYKYIVCFFLDVFYIFSQNMEDFPYFQDTNVDILGFKGTLFNIHPVFARANFDN